MPLRKVNEDGTEGTDDTAGNRVSLHSDAEIKHDVAPVGDTSSNEDTEGNRMFSDAEVKHDVTPVGDSEEGDDTEGNKKNFR